MDISKWTSSVKNQLYSNAQCPNSCASYIFSDLKIHLHFLCNPTDKSRQKQNLYSSYN